MSTDKINSNNNASDASWFGQLADQTGRSLEKAQSEAGRAVDRFLAGTGGDIILGSLYVAASPIILFGSLAGCGDKKEETDPTVCEEEVDDDDTGDVADDTGVETGSADCTPAANDDARQSVVQVPAECLTVESAFNLVKNDGTGTIEFTENYTTDATIEPPFSLTFASADDVTATLLPQRNSDGDTNVSPLVSVVSTNPDDPLSVGFNGVNLDGLNLSSAVASQNASLIFNDVLISDVIDGVVSTHTGGVSALTLDRVRFDDVEGAALSVNGGSASIGYVDVSESGTDQSLIAVSDDTDVTVKGGISIRGSRTEGAPLVSLSTPSTIASLIVYDSETSSAPLAEFTVGSSSDYGYLTNSLIFDDVYGDNCALTLNGYGNLTVDNAVFSSLQNTDTSETLLCLNPQEGGSVVVKNSIFDNNWDVNGAIISGLEPEDYSNGAVTYNDFYNNEGTEDPTVLDPTNLSVDPAYENSVDADCRPYDYLLSAGSSLIDAGVPSDRDEDGSRVDNGAFAGAGKTELIDFAAWVCGIE